MTRFMCSECLSVDGYDMGLRLFAACNISAKCAITWPTSALESQHRLVRLYVLHFRHADITRRRSRPSFAASALTDHSRKCQRRPLRRGAYRTPHQRIPRIASSRQPRQASGAESSKFQGFMSERKISACQVKAVRRQHRPIADTVRASDS